MDGLSEGAIQILDELHRERLDYNSEYVPLRDALDRLAAYEDAEEQGLLVRLPCKSELKEKMFSLAAEAWERRDT